ncbi:helix-turn-helix domain-containing protein [Herbaspirillum sp. NPDC087042]|uniref:helix-turn-helix domain-containing protein n=1 Tax=Herbaspirillum sp. NPDC087042 TaxID=3364004 RepID=UPI00381D8A55
MDSLISAAARALATGDPLGALKRVALREDASALALRGIAMAQLGDYPRARELLRRAARAFGSREPLSRARCIVAEAEVALAERDVAAPTRPLELALSTLQTHADHANTHQARLVAARRLLLLGRLQEAAAMLAPLAGQPLPPAHAALATLLQAELRLRLLDIDAARAAFASARSAAVTAAIPALLAEVEEAALALQRPAARRVRPEGDEVLGVEQVAALLHAPVLVVDGCRRMLARGAQRLPLARRPVLFALARTLAEAWPGDASRERLIEAAFRLRNPDETHRARLRVEIGRLRRLAQGLACIEASADGFVLRAPEEGEVALLMPPLAGEQAQLLALLADGAAWSTSALALALQASQRTVQRALAELEGCGQVRAIGRARARRWLAPPLAGFTTILLLPVALALP